MRLIEIAIICLVLLGLALVFRRPERNFRRGTGRPWSLAAATYSVLSAALLGLHLFFEGAHWQMIPVYLAMGLIVFLLWRSVGKTWRILGAVTVLAFVAAACALAYVLPVFPLPAPTGKYAVGTHIVSMIDVRRKEDADPTSGRNREVVVQIWYPAQPSRLPRAPYRRRSETSLVSSYQSVDWTHARYDAPVANVQGGFPILLYNPGWNGRRTQNTVLTEELASHGYVVVAIDHPYNSGPVALSDGRVVRPAPTPELADNVSTQEAIYALINKEVAKETDDTLFVLDQIERLNDDPASIFHGHLDLTKIGALGYSLGGAVAAETAHRSTKIKSVLVLDTPLYGEAAKDGVRQPLMLLYEQMPNPSAAERVGMSFGERRNFEMDEQDYVHQLPLFRRPGDFQIVLPGTLHTSFQDGILTSPLQRFSGAGAIPAKQLNTILRAYTVAFFEHSLQGVPSPLLSAKPSPFREAIVEFP